MPFAVIIEGDAKLFATFPLIAISLSSPLSLSFHRNELLGVERMMIIPGDGAAGDDGMCLSDGPTLHKII